MTSRPRILTLGDSALTVEFGRQIDAATHRRVMGLAAAVAAASSEERLTGVVETVPTIRSLTIHYDARRLRRAEFLAQLEPIIEASGESEISGSRWRLPVCYADDYAPDMQAVAEHTGLPADQVIELHSSTEYVVYMLGFMPGFGFLGGLPSELAVPRLANPRTRLPARSVAITGQMCAIYPRESPGGWRLIGRTPIEMFEAAHGQAPCLLAPGDAVRFYSVSPDEFTRYREQVEAGSLSRDSLTDGEQT